MIHILTSMLDTMIALVSFVIHTFTSLFDLLSRIPDLIAIITSSIGFLPDVVMPFALASLSILIVLFVLNRKG